MISIMNSLYISKHENNSIERFQQRTPSTLLALTPPTSRWLLSVLWTLNISICTLISHLRL